MSSCYRKPRYNKTAVLNKGKPHIFIGWIPTGGAIHPTCAAGQTDEWKKAQKNPKKKH